MKVLLLTTHIDIGGIGIYTVNLAKHLKTSGVEVGVLSSGGELEERLREGNISSVKRDMRTKSELGLNMWKNLPFLIDMIRDQRYDIVHAQTRVAQVMAHIAWKRTGVPYVTTCHGFFDHTRLGRRLFPCWGEKAIAISKNVMDHLINDLKVPGCDVRQIYNGIDLERFKGNVPQDGSGLKARLGLDPDKLTVGSVGRFSSVKGYKYLMDAFRMTKESVPDVQLLMVGKGPEKDMLQGLVDGYGISGDVVFDEGGEALLEEYLSLMDVFCLPSMAEGLGLSLMEAMASGCACIASDVGGLSELIREEEDGLLVPAADPVSLSGAMTRLLEDGKLRGRFAEKGRRKAVQNFSLEDSVARTIKVYQEVIDDKKRSGNDRV